MILNSSFFNYPLYSIIYFNPDSIQFYFTLEVPSYAQASINDYNISFCKVTTGNMN